MIVLTRPRARARPSRRRSWERILVFAGGTLTALYRLPCARDSKTRKPQLLPWARRSEKGGDQGIWELNWAEGPPSRWAWQVRARAGGLQYCSVHFKAPFEEENASQSFFAGRSSCEREAQGGCLGLGPAKHGLQPLGSGPGDPPSQPLPWASQTRVTVQGGSRAPARCPSVWCPRLRGTAYGHTQL